MSRYLSDGQLPGAWVAELGTPAEPTNTYNLRESREGSSIEFCAVHEAMRGICPRGYTATPENETRFKLLKAAYVDARYSSYSSMKYRISREDLEILANHVRELRARTERACRDHIALLAAAAAPPAQP